jgi:hypothetical protein
MTFHPHKQSELPDLISGRGGVLFDSQKRNLMEWVGSWVPELMRVQKAIARQLFSHSVWVCPWHQRLHFRLA